MTTLKMYSKLEFFDLKIISSSGCFMHIRWKAGNFFTLLKFFIILGSDDIMRKKDVLGIIHPEILKKTAQESSARKIGEKPCAVN